jgi:hypothetical protein
MIKGWTESLLIQLNKQYFFITSVQEVFLFISFRLLNPVKGDRMVLKLGVIVPYIGVVF